jgi:hypothetical protein
MAIDSVNKSSVPFGDRQRESGGILFPAVGGAVVGGAAGVLIRDRKPNLEGVTKDTFTKAMSEVKDLTDDQQKAAKAIEEHLATNPTEESKSESKAGEADAGTKTDAKGKTTAKPSVAAGGVTVENLFGKAEEMDPMKYLQEKYGYGTVQELIDGIKADRIALGGPEGKTLRSSIKQGAKGQSASEKIFNKVEQSMRQELAISELESRILEEEFKLEGMATGTKAEQSEKAMLQRRIDTMRKTLKTEQDKLVSFEADLKDNKAYQELKKAYEEELSGIIDGHEAPKAEAEAPKAEAPKTAAEKAEEAAKKAKDKINKEFLDRTRNAATNVGQHARNEITDRIKDAAKKKAEKSAKGLKGTERQAFIKKAQEEAVTANKERIQAYVELQQQKEIFRRLKNESTDRFKSLRHGESLEAQKGLIVSQRELSRQEASLLEKEKDLDIIRSAKKEGKKITKTQAEEVTSIAAAKAKEGIAKVARDAKGKVGDAVKAGAEDAKKLPAGIEEALKSLGKKLPKEFTKFNYSALGWGAAAGLLGGLVLKWIFGGKSEEQA